MPLLRARHPDRVSGELFSAAAEVAEMLGFSAYDAGRHGAAQRYFAQGLRLAGEAGDPVLGARTGLLLGGHHVCPGDPTRRFLLGTMVGSCRDLGDMLQSHCR